MALQASGIALTSDNTTENKSLVRLVADDHSAGKKRVRAPQPRSSLPHRLSRTFRSGGLTTTRVTTGTDDHDVPQRTQTRSLVPTTSTTTTNS